MKQLFYCLIFLLPFNAQAQGVDEILDTLLYTPEGIALLEAFGTLRNDYLYQVPAETLLQGAIGGMVAALDDPYTYYYPPARRPVIVRVAPVSSAGSAHASECIPRMAVSRLPPCMEGFQRSEQA